jgi:hypothetical protein
MRAPGPSPTGVSRSPATLQCGPPPGAWQDAGVGARARRCASAGASAQSVPARRRCPGRPGCCASRRRSPSARSRARSRGLRPPAGGAAPDRHVPAAAFAGRATAAGGHGHGAGGAEAPVPVLEGPRRGGRGAPAGGPGPGRRPAAGGTGSIVRPSAAALGRPRPGEPVAGGGLLRRDRPASPVPPGRRRRPLTGRGGPRPRGPAGGGGGGRERRGGCCGTHRQGRGASRYGPARVRGEDCAVRCGACTATEVPQVESGRTCRWYGRFARRARRPRSRPHGRG